MLGDTVRRARYAKDWSIEQLSKRSGVPGRLIREMEGGRNDYVPSEANMVLLAEALRVQRDSCLRRGNGCLSSGTTETSSDSHGGWPLLTEVRGRECLRSSTGKLQEIPHWKVVPLLAMLLP
jgi:transcriptional regulator with XRE-family HTH domain